MSRLIGTLSLPAAVGWLGFGWYTAEGFIIWDPRWWRWLLESWSFHGHPPPPMIVHFVVALAVLVGMIVCGKFLASRLLHKTVVGGFKKRHLHGSAHWATPRDVRRSGLLGKEGVTVGQYHGRPLRHNGPEHTLCFAPTRSGKGVSIVVPTLLEWPESAVVLDIKGENFALTAGYRASLGHRILRFEPSAESGSVRFNPLAEIRVGTRYETQDCQNIAAMILDPDGKGLNDFWARSGFEWLTAVIIHTLYRIDICAGRVANLSDVKKVLAGEAVREDLIKMTGDVVEAMLVEILAFKHGRGTTDRQVHSCARQMLGRAKPERSGVLSNVTIQLGLYVDPIVAANTGTSDFRIADIMNAERPVSLYVVVPPSEIDRLRPLLRLFFNLALKRMTSKMKFKDGRSSKSSRHRLLLMLDEFTSLGNLAIFENSLAYMAGYGLKCYLIVQDISQLKQAYGREESIISNCNIRIAFAPNKIETARLLSDMAGKTTVITKKRTRTLRNDKGGAGMSDSLAGMARYLMSPDECMQIPAAEKNHAGDVVKPGQMLIFPAGQPPIRGHQRLYFQDKTLLQRARMTPPVEPKNAAGEVSVATSLKQDIANRLAGADAEGTQNSRPTHTVRAKA